MGKDKKEKKAGRKKKLKVEFEIITDVPEPETDKSAVERAAGAEIYDWFQSIITALLICVLVFVFLFRVIGVIGTSMTPTLLNNDKIITTKLFYTPKHGDIVVLRKTSFDEKPIVKRVIATGGQTVDIDFDAGIVYVNGEPVDEPYVAEPTYRKINFDGEITAPGGRMF
ncbi:MAG: signal peptidase I, partial [Oscillospiraceae bacterium]|nr:signal peptidase I [Oscillospiraceae bacterium]